MVKDLRERKIAAEWISEALGGDAVQSRERGIHPGEKRGAK